MSSRLSLAILAGVAVSVTLCTSGCSLRQAPRQSTQFEINSAQMACFNRTGNQLESYFAGTASSADVDAMWSCVRSALDEFVAKTVGAQPGSYSSQELSWFLSTYFIREVPLTPELVGQVGSLKQALVGGSADRLTDSEIDRLKQLFEVLRQQMQNLRPFMPMMEKDSHGVWTGMGGQPWAGIDGATLDRFSSTLSQAASAIGNKLDGVDVPYSFDQLKGLMEALLGALPRNGDYAGTIQFLNQLESHFALLRAAKNTLLIPNSEMLASGSDWSDLLSSATSWWNIIVRKAWLFDAQRMEVSQEHIDHGAGLVKLEALFDRAETLFLKAVERHPNQIITFDELNQLVEAIPSADLKFEGELIPAKDIEFSLRPIIRRFIGGSDLGTDGRQAAGITPGILSKMSEIFHSWYEGDRFLDTLYTRVEQQEGDQDGADYLRATLLTSPAASTLWKQVLGGTEPRWNSETQLAAQRTRILLEGMRPLFHGLDDEITFSKYDEGLRYSFHDLATLNWMQTLSRQLIKGYAEKDPSEPAQGIPVRADADHWQPASGTMVGAGLTFAEFKQFYADFGPIAADLKFLDPVKSSPFSRFREGDVFTYVSDGNGYLDMDEASALLAFAFSARFRANRVQTDIAKDCNTTVDDPFYNQPLISHTCFANHFYKQVQEYWDKLDEMVPYYSSLTEDDKKKFQKLLETSGRTQGYQPNVPMTIDDTESLIGDLQYIEAIFSRYDSGDQGYLTPSDAEVAFPVFKNILEQMGETMNPPVKLDDGSADLVFTYMLAYGRVPSGAWDVIWWDILQHIPVVNDFKADRLRILEIFASLAQSTAKLSHGGLSATVPPSPQAK